MSIPNTQLLDLINAENLPAKLLTEVNVTLSPPELTEDGFRDTKVTITAVPGRGYRGSVEVTYQRVPLGLVAPTVTLRATEPFTVESTVDLLNSTYRLFLTPDDLVAFTPPTLVEGEVVTLTLQAHPDSKNFSGSSEVSFTYGRTLLSDVLGVKGLDVLKHPVTDTTRLSARMQTWGLDCTSIRAALKPTKTNTFTDFDAVLAFALYSGLPVWSGGTIVDSPTSAVPDANPAFDRVVVQASATSAEFQGRVYLHYNDLDGV